MMRKAVSVTNVPMRLAIKFGVSLATTIPLPKTWSPKCEMAETTSGRVFGVGMISRRCRYRGGLKKCAPKKCCRNSSLKLSLIADIEIPEVFEVTIEFGER